MTTIELSDEDAEKFKQFREHQDDFKTLLDNRVFSFYHGNAVIHRDKGIIMQININDISFKREKKGKKFYTVDKELPKNI